MFVLNHHNIDSQWKCYIGRFVLLNVNFYLSRKHKYLRQYQLLSALTYVHLSLTPLQETAVWFHKMSLLQTSCNFPPRQNLILPKCICKIQQSLIESKNHSALVLRKALCIHAFFFQQLHLSAIKYRKITNLISYISKENAGITLHYAHYKINFFYSII